jgi:diguanylate cyclase (GGDEF)-like protein
MSPETISSAAYDNVDEEAVSLTSSPSPTVADTRNATPPLREWRFWAVVVPVLLGAAVVLFGHAVPEVQLRLLPAAFWMVAALVVVGELRPLFTARALDANGLVMSTTFVFAVLLEWGLGPAVVLQVLATVLADLPRRKALWRSGFNVAQYVLSWAAAYLVLTLVGRHVSPAEPTPLEGADLPAILLAAVTYFVVNNLLVSAVLAVKTHTRIRDHFFDEFGWQLVASGGLLALSPLVVLAAERSWMLVPLIVVPLFAVYQNARISVEQQHLALHDSLTGLPNRKLLFERAAEATEGRSTVGLLLLDLDRFKEVNDTLGHHSGDRVLEEMARRLSLAVRPGDTVARLGGDEFAVLLPDVADESVAVAVAERIAHVLGRPFTIPAGDEDVVLELDASVGIALHPEHAADFEGLLQRADTAMYAAKERGTGWSVYAAG